MADRKATIAYLTTNCKCWKDSETILDKLPDAKLNAMMEDAQAAAGDAAAADVIKDAIGAPETVTPEELKQACEAFAAQQAENARPRTYAEWLAAAPPGEAKQAAEALSTNKGKPATMQDWLAQAPPEAKAVWNNAVEALNREKADLLDRLTANAQDGAKKAAREVYAKMDLPQLRTLAEALPPAPATNGFLMPDYSGAAGAPTTNAKDDSDNILPIPTIEDRRKQA